MGWAGMGRESRMHAGHAGATCMQVDRCMQGVDLQAGRHADGRAGGQARAWPGWLGGPPRRRRCACCPPATCPPPCRARPAFALLCRRLLAQVLELDGLPSLEALRAATDARNATRSAHDPKEANSDDVVRNRLTKKLHTAFKNACSSDGILQMFKEGLITGGADGGDAGTGELGPDRADAQAPGPRGGCLGGPERRDVGSQGASAQGDQASKTGEAAACKRDETRRCPG